MHEQEGLTHPKNGLPVLLFPDAAAWQAWLELNAADVDGLWLRFARKGSGVSSVTYDEAVELALCFGWIDGQANRWDDETFILRFTPRRRRSVWSKVNVDRVEALIAAGRMRPGGLAEVERAKADGRWAAAYPGSATMPVPDELAAALAGAGLTTAWEAMPKADRYSELYALHNAKRPETRTRRIARLVERLAAG